MRLSKTFWQTFKEVPADAEIASHRLMIRAGLIQKSGAGIYNYMPFGLRVIKKVEGVIREELNKIGAQEILMTVITPGELWRKSGRWDLMTEMLKFKDKKDRDLCISPTNEEAVTDIFSTFIKSYKELPQSLYQINTKFRDEIRPRFGLMRGREFTMKDGYSFHLDKACLDDVYDDFFKAYEAIFNKIGLEFSPVEADAGAMASSDSKTHEFQVIADSGEDEIIYCGENGYAANIEKAKTKRAKLDFLKSNEPSKEIETPNMETIEEVCSFLKCPQHHSLKSLVYEAITGEESEFVLLQLLGDDSLNELKLKAFLKCDELRPATDNQLKSLELLKGFIGPVGLLKEIRTIFDEAADLDAAYVVGAQKEDFHLENVIPKRDVKNFEVADLRLAGEGDLTVEGSHPVKIKRGIEVGHIFQLGDKYTKAMDVSVLDQNGKKLHPLMGCYGIGVTRVVAAAIEQFHDEAGIIWPQSIAPFQLYFASIAKKDETKELAEKIYKELLEANVEVIFDDRKAGPGFKFKDSDLLGLPYRLVLGDKTFEKEGALELVCRKTGNKELVKPEDVVKKVLESVNK